MAKWLCVVVALACLAIPRAGLRAQDPPLPAPQEEPSPPAVPAPLGPPAPPADHRSCCRKLWEFATFRYPSTPRPCQHCLAYPIQSCSPPLYQFFVHRYPRWNQEYPAGEAKDEKHEANGKKMPEAQP